MATALTESLFRFGGREAGAGIKSSARDSVENILRGGGESLLTQPTSSAVEAAEASGTREISKVVTERAGKAGAAETTRETEKAETKLLNDTVKPAKPAATEQIVSRSGRSPGLASNADRVGTGAGTFLVKGVVATGLGVGIYEGVQSINAVDNTVSHIGDGISQVGKDLMSAAEKTYDAAGNNLHSLHEGANNAANALLERGETISHLLPNSTTLTNAGSAVAQVTGSVTTLLLVGVAIYAAFEISRFVRR